MRGVDQPGVMSLPANAWPVGFLQQKTLAEITAIGVIEDAKVCGGCRRGAASYWLNRQRPDIDPADAAITKLAKLLVSLELVHTCETEIEP